MRARRPAGRTRRWAGRLGLAAASLVASLLVAEAAARFLELGPKIAVLHRERYRASENPWLRYELQPGAPDGAHRINAAGFRDRDFPEEKPPGMFRIAVVGDSVTYGYGSRETSYPKQLEALLRERDAPEGRGPRFEVLNFGVKGYNITQSVERLRTLALRYEPDLAVYGYVLNDPQGFSLEADSLGLSSEPDSGAPWWRRASSALRHLLARSRLVLMARHAWSGAAELRDPTYAALRGGRGAVYLRSLHERSEGARRLQRGLEALARTAESRSLPVLVVLLPVALEDPPGEDTLDGVYRKVAAEARARGLDVLDLRRPFADARREIGRPLHVDPIHLRPAGHRLVAAAIFNRLLRDDRLPELRPRAGRAGAPPRARPPAAARDAREPASAPSRSGI